MGQEEEAPKAKRRGKGRGKRGGNGRGKRGGAEDEESDDDGEDEKEDDEWVKEVERKVVYLFLDPAYDEPMMIAGFRTRGRRCTRPLNWWFEEGGSLERDITLGYQRGGPPTKFFVLVRKKPLPRARQVD